MLPSTKPLPPPAGYRDPSSVSDPARVYTTHINLDIGVDFEIEMVGGTATLALSILDESVTHVDLDGRGLIVRKCVDANTELDLAWELERDVTSVGDRLRITLPDNAALKGHARVTVYYASRGTGAPGGGAIDWTAGDDTTPPFMFTQAQAIHARSFFPCQDTPAVKSTGQYNVKVITPHEDLQVLMSAVYLGPDGEGHSFVQNVPIPSYLVALAVGDLKKEQVSSRCAVWAQSDMLEQAKAKFEKMDDFLATAEKVAGPYVWGVCDVLVLPSSFPYGGMENPCLTFLTPSLLSGPPSSSVVIHEIAHSWSGNLVTARDFRHFWLNEGMTVKLERRILREAYGKEREGLDAHMGRTSLQNYIRVRGEDHPHTCLVVDLKDGQDPDDAFSCVPYEKGYNFLCYLEHLIVKEGGEQDAFDIFMKEYFAHFAHQTVNTDEFVKYFTEKFPGVAPLVDFDAWFHTPGQCPALAPIDMTLVTAASELASEWKDVCSTVPADKRAAALAAKFAEDAPAVRKWDSKQKQLFLSELRELVETEVDAAGECEWWDLVSCGRLTSLYELDADEDSEVRFLWCRIGLRAGRDESVEITKKFLAAYGRMKYVRPLFQDLHKVYPKGDMAKALFMERQGGYHDICNKMVARDLKIPILVADS